MDPLFPVLPDTFDGVTDEELSALLDEHQVAWDKLDAEDPEYTGSLGAEEILAAMEAGLEQITRITGEQKSRAEANEAYLAAKARLSAEKSSAVSPEPAVEEIAGGDSDETLAVETVEPEITPEPEVEVVEPEPVLVAAAAPPPRVYRKAPAATPIRVISEDPQVALVAAAGVEKVRPGEPLDRERLAQAIIDTARRMGRPTKSAGGTLERSLIASLRWPFPEDRKLSKQDLDGNLHKIRMAGNPFLGAEGKKALVASGGLCAPLEPFYDQPNLSTAARPVRAALPSFMADRGGISVPTPSTIGDITTAISVISEEEDALGGTYATKSCQDLTCPSWTDVAIYIISHCREYGNLNAMAWPEGIAHENDITMAAHSRVAEGALLDRLAALSLGLTYTTGYGAVSVLLGGLLKARNSTQSVLRMDPGTRFRALAPFWLADVLAWDVANSQFGRFDTPQDAVAGLFSRYNIDVSWYLDTETGGGQVFADEVDSSTVDDWDNNPIVYLFPEGTFLHIDSGDLELGIVRDSTLNSTNDFQVFGETFENVARIGPAQAAKKITFTACPDGRVAAPEATEITCS